MSMGRHGLQHHRGLLHVSTVSSERLDAGRVPSFMEDHVGPVGSKVGPPACTRPRARAG